MIKKIFLVSFVFFSVVSVPIHGQVTISNLPICFTSGGFDINPVDTSNRLIDGKTSRAEIASILCSQGGWFIGEDFAIKDNVRLVFVADHQIKIKD